MGLGFSLSHNVLVVQERDVAAGDDDAPARAD